MKIGNETVNVHECYTREADQAISFMQRNQASEPDWSNIRTHERHNEDTTVTGAGQVS